MSTSTGPLITRPGGHSAKNAHRAGAPNTQLSGETPMVGNSPTADIPAVTDLQDRLHGRADRFVRFDHTQGSVTVHYRHLAEVVAELLAEHTAQLRGEVAELRRECEVHQDSIAELRFDLDAAREGMPIGGAR